VKALADAFDLQPGAPGYDEFVLAAKATASIKRSNRAFSALALKSALGAVPEDPRPFVAEGREPHLERLHNAIVAAVNGMPDALFVSADPGTGKTWLLEEACRRSVAHYPGLVTVWADCASRLGTAFLTKRADGLTDAANRESYLTNVPSHRRVFELAAALAAR
jgi:hypothetical protein